MPQKTRKKSVKAKTTGASRKQAPATLRSKGAKTSKKTATRAKPKTARSTLSKVVSKAEKTPARALPPAAAKPKAASPQKSTSPLIEGAAAPSFTLPRDGGKSVSLADYAGRKLVIFFYPRADTPGCTREAIDFSRLSAAFTSAKTAIIGVSADPLKAQESFRDKHKLAVPLLSDEQQRMLKAYGVWGEKSMYGKMFFGVVRTTVLIGSDGTIIRVWQNVKVDGHADEVLAAAKSA